MSAVELIRELESKGVTLEPKGDKLKFRAPSSVWLPDLEARVKAAKPEVLLILKAKPFTDARIRGQDRAKLAYAPDVCWHCHGTRFCDCALCGTGMPGQWQAGQCGGCRGTGYLAWRDRVQ